MKKAKDGITLIALIITIMVMLILVGVTVTAAINGGLFGKAKEGAEGTIIAREKEELTVAIVTAYDERTGKINKGKLETALGDKWTVEGVDGGQYSVKSPEGNTFIVKQDGTITAKKTPQTGTIAALYCDIEGCTEETHLHKGDYVEYTPTTAQAYDPDYNPNIGKSEEVGKLTGYTTEAGAKGTQSISQETLNWRVMGQDENNNILLISGAPTNSVIYFYGNVGYNNYEDVLNNTCKALYSNTKLGATARSITMKDVETYLGGGNYDKTKFDAGLGGPANYGYTNTIHSRVVYDENNNLIKLEGETTKEIEVKSTYYSYEITEDLIGAKNKEILTGKNSEYINWIAGKGALVYGLGAWWCFELQFRVGIGCFWEQCDSIIEDSDGPRWRAHAACIRPVVILPADARTVDVAKIQGGVTENWDSSGVRLGS